MKKNSRSIEGLCSSSCPRLIRRVLIPVLLLLALSLQAQTNQGPVQLALIAESPGLNEAENLLTSELSGNPTIHLLERDEIEKVYREQGLSAANRDDLKLGRILGADGLLLLEVVRTKQVTNLMARLLAVKPGVVLMNGSFPWPMKDMVGWSQLLATHLDDFLPKLTVLAKDAIPISVVNLRSAVSSDEAADTERELKMLTIQRLSREPRLFVLERQRMGLLSGEKELKSDASAFWGGSYLLDGVVDQNGYSRKTITLNARLTPPKGLAPLLFEISGSRTNLVEVVNRLAARVTELLNVHPTVTEWSTQKEAEQYYKEAKWALKWGIYPEARATADSAWALGRHDMDCAIVRISAYENPPNIVALAYSDTLDSSITDSAKKSDRDFVIRDIKKAGATYTGVVFAFGKHGINSIAVAKPPDPQALDRMTRSLNMYREFSGSLSPVHLKSDSAWYRLGVEVLISAAGTLQAYYLVPKSQEGVAEKLADLRALARWVDGWILHSSSARESILSCELAWGCFWQENPEDCVTLYRGLLANNAYNIVWDFDSKFGRERRVGLKRPRLIAWHEQDRQRIPDVWDSFVRDLIDSTNAFLRIEGKKFEAIENPARLNEQEVVAQYKEYWNDIQTAKSGIEPPEKQNTGEKRDLTSAINDFISTDSTSAQAQKLKPLLAAYKSNLIRLMQSKSGSARRNLKLAIAGVADVQAMVARKISPEAVRRNATPVPNPGRVEHGQRTAQNVLLVRKYLPIPFENFPRDEKLFEEARKWAFRILGSRWCEGKLVLDVRYDCEMHANGGGGDIIKAGAALFNPSSERWETILYPPIASRNGYPVWPYDGVSLGILNGNLYLVQNEESPLEGNVVGFTGRILKYDFKTRKWQGLKIPALGTVTHLQDRSRLFVIDHHLYIANSGSIFEIIDNGQATHILASTRRRPAATPLDSFDTLGSPILFSGLSNSLCACVASNTYCWDGTDWRKLFTLNISQPPEVFEEAVVFRYKTWPINNASKLWLWDKDLPAPRLALYEKPKAPRRFPFEPQLNNRSPATLWSLAGQDAVMRSAATWFASNLYFFVEHAAVTNVSGRQTLMERDGCHARLVCFSPGFRTPFIVPLAFDLSRGQPPLECLDRKAPQDPSHLSSSWLHFAGDNLYIGEPGTPGVWAIPISEVRNAVAAARGRMQTRKARRTAAQKKSQQELLKQYDRNHNGQIDGGEREAALADPLFIKSELESIDTNHNGWIDAAELAWFDANRDQKLESNEQRGIELAQESLAASVLRQFDADESGTLDRAEFTAFWQQAGFANFLSATAVEPFNWADRNHDGSLTATELAAVLTEASSRSLWRRLAVGKSFHWRFNLLRMNPQSRFKAEVEACWRGQRSPSGTGPGSVQRIFSP